MAQEIPTNLQAAEQIVRSCLLPGLKSGIDTEKAQKIVGEQRAILQALWTARLSKVGEPVSPLIFLAGWILQAKRPTSIPLSTLEPSPRVFQRFGQYIVHNSELDPFQIAVGGSWSRGDTQVSIQRNTEEDKIELLPSARDSLEGTQLRLNPGRLYSTLSPDLRRRELEGHFMKAIQKHPALHPLKQNLGEAAKNIRSRLLHGIQKDLEMVDLLDLSLNSIQQLKDLDPRNEFLRRAHSLQHQLVEGCLEFPSEALLMTEVRGTPVLAASVHASADKEKVSDTSPSETDVRAGVWVYFPADRRETLFIDTEINDQRTPWGLRLVKGELTASTFYYVPETDRVFETAMRLPLEKVSNSRIVFIQSTAHPPQSSQRFLRRLTR